MPKLHLTDTAISKLQHPSEGQVFYWDDELPGFGVRLTAGDKVFIVQGRVAGKNRRVKICPCSKMTAQQARREAKRKLGEMPQGIDHNAEKAAQRAKVVTVEKVWLDYQQDRSLRPRTVKLYGDTLKHHFADWQHKRMVDIDRQMVRERYALIKKTVAEASAKRTRPGKQRTSEPGKAEASVAMRFLSSLFVYAQESYEDTNKRAVVVENPVKALKTAEKSWRTVPRRQNVILPGELSKFYEGLELLRSDTARDYLLGLMLTGLRRRELAALTWDEIDWDNKSLIIPASRTKNKKAHGLPLSDVLLAMLKRRKETASGLYVFPNRKEGRFFDDPSASIRTVAAHMGKSWSCHDARRSFITVAEMLEIPPYTLKMLLNHSNGDVTGGYIISNIERLRGPMQQITDFMIERMGAPSPKPEDSKVTEISRAVAKRAAREKG